MNAYRTQQQFRAKIAEIERQQREICKQYGLHIIPDEPKQPETGDKRTLTPRRKCGIIKAIRRHVRRWKRKQEGKKMKNDFTLFDGCTIELVSLGRDDGAEIIGRDPAGKVVCYIATENATQDRAAIVQAIKDGAQTIEQVFNMWENGLGGSPFDMEYLPEDYK